MQLVATLGVLARFDLLHLPAQLHLLENWWIIGASAILFANRDCAAGDNHPPDPVGDSLSAGLTPRRRAKVSEVIRSRWITIQIPQRSKRCILLARSHTSNPKRSEDQG